MAPKKFVPIPATPAELEAVLAELQAENEALAKASEGGIVLAEEKPVVKGMSEPVNMTTTVLIQHPYKFEKIQNTIRKDMGFDPNQQFTGRQP